MANCDTIYSRTSIDFVVEGGVSMKITTMTRFDPIKDLIGWQ
jgi:hypothetical protein